MPLEPAGLGVFEAVVEAAPGADYEYVLDGVALPDPCSRWQPDGLRGPSRLLDTGAFAWTDDGWSPPAVGELVLYELHVGTFTAEGTFEAAIPHLRELRELGVTAIELMPVGEFPGRHGWGYDGVYLSAAQSSYGGPQGLQRLVDAAHAEGLAVILDVVYNHVGASGTAALTAFGPYLTVALRDPVGRRDQLRRRRLRRRARVGAAERRAVGPRLPRRRPAAGRGARDHGREPRAPGGRRRPPHRARVRDRRVGHERSEA